MRGQFFNRRLVRWLAAGILFVILCIGFAALRRKSEPARPAAPAPDPAGIANIAHVAPDAAYVGDRQCAECHASIAESYARTAMGQSWRRPATAERIEDYDSPHDVVNADGYRYQVYREGDRTFQKEYRTNRAGEVAYTQVRPVSYVLGSGVKGRAYVTDSNGYLTIMPVAWYSHGEKWDLNPGYHTNNRRFSREVAATCIMCHNSYPDYVAGSRNRYREPLPEGIGCERCHGPGERHVRAQRAQQAGSEVARGTGAEQTIVNPANLSQDLQQDVCLQCHLTTDAGMVFHRGKSAFQFRPGQRLAEHRAQFQTAGQRGEAFSATSHGTRMALSRCFTESNARMTCIYCHDPHVPVREVPGSFFNSRCMTCHQQNECSRTPSDAAAHATNDCIACHMPKRPATDIEHTVTADHWIRKQSNADETRTADVNGTSEPAVLEDFFHNASTGEQGIAYASYGVRWQDARSLQQAADLLTEALRREPGDARWCYWLGYVLLSQGRFANAAQYLERAWTSVATGAGRDLVSEDEQIALYGDMVRVYVRLGRPERVMEVTDAFHRAMPQYIPAYETYMEMASVMGRRDLAIGIASRGLKQNPAVANFWWVLARKELELDRQPDRAIQSLKRAIELDPLRSEFLAELARAHQALGQNEQAEEALRLAAELAGPD